MRASIAITIAAALIVAPLLSAPECSAAVITVRHDGTGDHTTVTGAVAASSVGDTILVSPGTYLENDILVTNSLSILSTDGPDSTTLDGRSLDRILKFNGAGTDGLVDGFTFVNGLHTNVYGTGAFTVYAAGEVTVRNCVFKNNAHSALSSQSGSRVIVEDCVFEDNTASYTAGAVYVDVGAQLEATGCIFRNNRSDHTAGAMSVIVGAYASLVDCDFVGNHADSWGGAILTDLSATVEVDRCFFAGNSADVGSAMRIFNATVTVSRSTFFANEGLGDTTATIVVYNTADISRNIFAQQINGYGLSVPTNAHSCNLFWQNSAGSVIGSPLVPDEMVADPAFCDTANGDFTVASTSPAAPAFNPCYQLIGAREIGCILDLNPIVTTIPESITEVLVTGTRVTGR